MMGTLSSSNGKTQLEIMLEQSLNQTLDNMEVMLEPAVTAVEWETEMGIGSLRLEAATNNNGDIF